MLCISYMLIGTKGYAKLNSFILENDNTKVENLVQKETHLKTNRPPKRQRLFISDAVETEIKRDNVSSNVQRAHGLKSSDYVSSCSPTG